MSRTVTAAAARVYNDDEEGASRSVIFETEPETAGVPHYVPLREHLRSAGYAAVDNSGSTRGLPLEVAQKFVTALGVPAVSLWNTYCDPPCPLTSARWISTGGTKPESVFQPHNHVPAGATAFVFMTDGQVHNTAPLARHAGVTAHLASLLVIFAGERRSASTRIANYNVSVLMAHFSAARTAAVLLVDGSHIHNDSATLIAVKGTWIQHLPTPPDLSPSLEIGECPLVTMDQLHSLASTVYPAQSSGSVPLDERRSIDLELLLQVQEPAQVHDILRQVSDENLEDVARAFYTLGRLREWRSRLNQWLAVLNQTVAAEVQEQTQQSTAGILSLLRRVRNAGSEAERGQLRMQLQAAMQGTAAEAAAATAEANREQRGTRGRINEQLEALAQLEGAGMSAAALGRLSNRAGRAAAVDRDAIAVIAQLDLGGAPEEEDVILFERGPVALCLRAMEDTEDNTSDFALDQALRVGQEDRNAVFEPTLVAIDQGMADRVEQLDVSPLTRQHLSVCLPIVSLASDANRRAVLERLCLVFMNELRMPHVWLIALSSILRCLEREEWAHPTSTPTGRALAFMATQIMQHVTLPAGSRLSPQSALRVNEALGSLFRTDILTQHSSVIEASVILRLLHRFGASVAIAATDLQRAMLARIARAVPQSHRGWLQRNSMGLWDDQGPTSVAALMSSIFETRVTELGQHVAIAGSGRLADSLEGLLLPADVDAVARLARALGVPMHAFVTPGLSLVVSATLQRLTNPAVSSSAAVDLVRGGELVAAEMDAATAGLATAEQAVGVVRRQLAWARVPLGVASPFVTPLGPSALWFYASDGVIIDMTEGFEVWPGEVEEDRDGMIMRLTEHVRTARGRLMARYYGTDTQGSLVAGTIAAPVHRAMVDELRGRQADEDLTDPHRAARFIHRAVQRVVARSGASRGNLHYESMERLAAALLPSLLAAAEAFPALDFSKASDRAAVAAAVNADVLASDDRRLPANLRRESSTMPLAGDDARAGLAARVSAELGDRVPGQLGEPPAAVFVPLDDPEVNATLERVQQEQTALRAEALRRRRNPSAAADDAPRPAADGAADMRTVSRRVTRYLRHEATTRADGFVPADTILASLGLAGVDADMLLRIVAMDDKGRFDVVEEDGVLLLRANQGHTVSSVDPEQLMTPIDNPNDVPICLHGTYERTLTTIVRSGGLNRMARQAIQMAVGLPSDPEVRSGIRPSIDVVIYVDVAAAMARGLRFYRSSNNVICCPGPIPVSCFLRVVRMEGGSLVDIDAISRSVVDGT